MPYTQDSNNLPEYVKKRSPEVRKKWIAIFNAALKESGDEKVAFAVANKWLQKQVKEKQIVARSAESLTRVSFVIDDSSEFIKRTDDGDDYISFKLADVFEDKFGIKLPENLLQKWADYINGNPIVGDVDHKEYDYWLEQGLKDDEIMERIRNKKGIAKTLKAVVDKGRLWVKAIIDKRYKKVIRDAKGVSLEALLSKDDNGNIIDGQLLGFTFGVKHNPVIEGTEIYHGTA